MLLCLEERFVFLYFTSSEALMLLLPNDNDDEDCCKVRPVECHAILCKYKTKKESGPCFVLNKSREGSLLFVVWQMETNCKNGSYRFPYQLYSSFGGNAWLGFTNLSQFYRCVYLQNSTFFQQPISSIEKKIWCANTNQAGENTL